MGTVTKHFPGSSAGHGKRKVLGSITATISGGGTNLPPVADAGPDRTAQRQENIFFDGSDSYDPDGTIVGHLWDYGDGKTGTGETVSHKYKKAGTYQVTLTVTDNDSDEGQDTAVITVQ